jgi:glycosyltransferase involved in cell wall biosynthesis
LFSLHEEDVAPDRRDALAREISKLEVIDPVYHPVHLFDRPRHVPRVAWLRLARGVPYLAGKWEAPAVRAALDRELRDHAADVVWLETLGIARYLPLVRRHQPNARVIVDTQNVDSDIWEQFARRQPWPKRFAADAEVRAIRDFERDALSAADAVGAISESDARALRAVTGVDAVVVPQVVTFTRRTVPVPGARVCYVGYLAWHPNARGVDWFLAEVWPHVRAALPDATLEIAGSGLPTDARGAVVSPPAWRASGVTTLGFVSDLGPLYARSAVMVAPVLEGSGIRIKLLDAFRSGVPVVTTPQGAAGLPIEPGRQAYVEAAPRAFAQRVIDVATSPERQAQLREEGYSFLERYHGLERAQAAVRVLIEPTTVKRSHAPSRA